MLSILSFFPAALLYFVFMMERVIRLCFKSVIKDIEARLPFYELLASWHKTVFKKFREACFDLIHAPISYHFKKDEMHALAKKK